MKKLAPKSKSKTVDHITATSMLLIRCIQGCDTALSISRDDILQNLSDEGFEKVATAANPMKHLESATKASNAAVVAADLAHAQELLNAACLSVLLLSLGRELGPVLPEVVIASLVICLNPDTGIVSQSREESCNSLGRAFKMIDALKKRK